MRWSWLTLLAVACSPPGGNGDDRDGKNDSVALFKNTHPLEGYVDRVSVAPGETLTIMAHAPKGRFAIRFVRYGADREVVREIAEVAGASQDYPHDAAQQGCDWASSFELVIPQDWSSGLYSATLVDDTTEFPIGFVVREVDPGSSARIAVMTSTHTWQAYNLWGDDAGVASFYGKKPAAFASMHRPTPTSNPEHQRDDDGSDVCHGSPHCHTAAGERFVLAWLEANALPYSVLTNLDLHEDPAILQQFDVVILNAHDEYWSTEMYDGLVRYLETGRDLISLGANQLFWKVTITDDVVETRKPNTGSGNHSNGERGGLWSDLGRPGSAVLGAEYVDTKHISYNTCAGYRVLAADHWAFAGTELANSDMLGERGRNQYLTTTCPTGGASGLEMDNIVPGVSPANLIHLAKGANPNSLEPGAPGRGGDMVIYDHPGGGRVFSVGSITFTGSMVVDAKLGRVVKNVVDRFLAE
jgi:N,N-dimethylformamidase